MVRATAGFLSVLVVASFVSPANGQQLVNKGVLVTQILARTRFGVFERGDLVHVTVHQPAGNKGLTLSVHAEYIDGAGKWQQVPPPKSMLAALYQSGNYGGLRDYVDINGVAEATTRNVALFMPFDGFALEQGRDCTFRYVLRLWEPRPPKTVSDKELAHVALEPYRIHVGHDAEGILISIVDPRPCTFFKGEKGKPVAQAAGIVRFFDTATGKWECPECNSAVDHASARR
jgi:rubredoxin